MQKRHVFESAKARVMGCLMALCMVAMAAVPAVALAAPLNGWDVVDGERYWYDDGVMARDKQVYDPETNAWYWFDADGTMARGKDVFVPVSNDDRTRGKWVRYDTDGHMVKGQDYRYGGWYYFDPVTGEMAKGFAYVPDDGKWAFYDRITGQMLYGEQAIDGGWYYLDDYTGAVTYGRKELPGKTVYYDDTTGRMLYGWHDVDIDGDNTAERCHFDEYTGALIEQQEIGSNNPSSNPDLNTIVYVTTSGNGEKYHYEWCSTIRNSNVRSLTVQQAKEQNFGPCRVCNPPA